jgi:hypothetical protein
MEVAYSRLVTISTDNIAETNEYRSGVGAHWTFLSDAGRRVQKDLDIAEYTDPTHNPMIPHTIVLESGLVVYKVYNGYWFWGRPPSKISARTSAPSPKSAAPTGTSPTPNTVPPGNAAKPIAFTPTEKPTPLSSANRTRQSSTISVNPFFTHYLCVAS